MQRKPKYARRQVVEVQQYQGDDWRALADFGTSEEAQEALRAARAITHAGSGIRYRIKTRLIKLADVGLVGQDDRDWRL